MIATGSTTPGDAEPSVLVPYATSSVGPARRALSADLSARGLTQALVEDATLVLSEMLGNALRHASPLPESGRVRLDWKVEQSGGSVSDVLLTLQVSDGGGSTRPRVLSVASSETGGRGMGIVQTLADDWGVSDNGAGSTVWATLHDGGERGRVIQLPD